MKIAFLSFYSGVVYRGVETYVHELSNRLVLLGHDVTVYQGGSKLPNAKYKTVSIKNSFFEKSVTKKNLFTNSLARTEAVRSFSIEALKQMNKSVDVVIATNNRFQALLCRYWTKKNKAKLVIHGQGGPGIDERIALWCFPDLFIPLSLYQKEWAERVNPFVKVSEVVHNGVDLEKFNAGTKAIKINLPKPIILCVGALWPMKRLHLLIKAVAKLKNASLLIVGEGEYKDELNILGKKLLGNRFLITSFPHDQMPSVYATADLFSYPTSTWESFGIVLVEAIASGLGVVATDDPIRREIVGNAGIFVDPTDTKAYSEALKEALETNWGDEPRKQAEKFSWDKIAKQYEKLFTDLTK